MMYLIQFKKFGAMVILLLSLNQPLQSQETSLRSILEISNQSEEIYGPDMSLINGEKYHYPYRAATGNPFLTPDGDRDASLQIKGVVYDNQYVKYDIYNQLIVLEFSDMTGASNSIILRDELVDQFVLGSMLFKKYPQEDRTERFVQVIFEGEITCFYYWKKRYSVDTKVGQNHYTFSDPTRESFLVLEEQAHPYKGKRGFLRCLPVHDRLMVKGYMKKNRIRIRKADDMEMQELLGYINQIHSNDN